MSLDPPPYLSSLQTNIRTRPIPWEGAVRARTITDHDLKRIKGVDKVRKEQRRQTVESDPEPYRSLLLGGQNEKSVLESAAKRPEIINYILVLANDLINDVPDFGTELLKHSDPYKPFLPLLTHSSNPEESIPLLSSTVLSSLLSIQQTRTSSWTPKSSEALKKLFNYLAKLTQSHDSGLQDIAVLEYSSVIRGNESRKLFWEQRKETLEPLMDVLRSAGGLTAETASSTLFSGSTSVRNAADAGISGGVSLQLLYHVLLVVWQLSYEGEDIGEAFDKEQDIIALYTHLLRLSPKEKTTRLLLSTLYNILSTNKSSLLPVATSVRLPAVLANLKTRHLSDEDLLEDLNHLDEMLSDYTSAQTTFDEYASEVQAGHLRWSPPHKDASFWSENADRILSENKGELPKKLAEILSKSWDEDKQVLAVACNDVGWLVKTVPEKRTALEKLGLKPRVMDLMADANETVRWEALKAVGEWMRYSFGS